MAPQPTDSPALVSDRNNVSTAPTSKLTSSSSTLISALAASRVVLGAAAFLAPRITSQLFKVDALPGASLITRIFGVRESVLGGLTAATLRDHESKKELRRMLWAGVAVDSMDVVACLIILSSSDTTEAAAAKTTAMVGLGAALFGLFTIHSVDWA
ncbi:unnamed protein product [Clonostachys chloroleuca]|uniref:Uncharacterized protein n=1 Tax=Clonostachys chloroleuca TaxID=1926264 RepID=A0AA35MEK6_9HYPO|nr:unnamed protein product [Clonostachys chloroleuca]